MAIHALTPYCECAGNCIFNFKLDPTVALQVEEVQLPNLYLYFYNHIKISVDDGSAFSWGLDTTRDGVKTTYWADGIPGVVGGMSFLIYNPGVTTLVDGNGEKTAFGPVANRNFSVWIPPSEVLHLMIKPTTATILYVQSTHYFP